MNNWLAVFIGGGLGSILRYGLSFFIKSTDKGFPISTLVANISASFLLGFFTAILLSKYTETHWLKYFLIIGLCGGFSTFSTFSLDTFRLIEQNSYLLAFENILFSCVACIIAIFIGLTVGKMI